MGERRLSIGERYNAHMNAVEDEYGLGTAVARATVHVVVVLVTLAVVVWVAQAVVPAPLLVGGVFFGVMYAVVAFLRWAYR